MYPEFVNDFNILNHASFFFLSGQFEINLYGKKY